MKSIWMKLAAGSLLVAGLALGGQRQDSVERQLRAARNAELVDGNLKAAIEQYKKVALSGNRALAAQALLYMAECYQKLGDSQAPAILQQILTSYADQKEVAAAARSRLGGAPSSNTSAHLVAPGLYPGGGPSADGRYISSIHWNTGDLGVRDLVTGEDRILTNSGGWEASGDYVEAAVISPDNRQIAYTWKMVKENRSELRIISTTSRRGAPAQTIQRSESFGDYMLPYGWTPDGKQILAVRSSKDRTVQIGMTPAVGETFRVVKSLPWQPDVRAALSPDGRYIAYDYTDANSKLRNISVIAVDGSHESALALNQGNSRNPHWTPDGRGLIFTSDRTGDISLWLARINDGKPAGPQQILKPQTGAINLLGITKAGSLVYIAPGAVRRNILTADLDAEMKGIKAPATMIQTFINTNWAPSLSPDATRLVYYSMRLDGEHLMLRAIGAGEEREIPNPLAARNMRGIGPLWFPDNESVLVLSPDVEKGACALSRLNTVNGRTEFLESSECFPAGMAISPDGKSIFYVKDNDGITNSIVRFDIDTRRETELKTGEWFLELAVSPHGEYLAYLVSAGATSYLAIMPANGGDSRALFRSSSWIDGSRYSALSFSPDGRYLIFVRGGLDPAPNSIWRVPVEGGPAEPLNISMKGYIKVPQIVSGGRRIIFGHLESSPVEVWALENFLP